MSNEIRVTREELINQIKSNPEQFAQEYINLYLKQKNYGLVYDTTEATREIFESSNSVPVLTEICDRSIINDSESPVSLLIEGENFHALTALAYTHAGLVDVIYIDPPYNTGNEDFVYNDKFVDTEDPFRHSKWLNFMEKRLRIARELLSDCGIIFISIDDNEHSNLKLLCDSIFGETNLMANLIWDLGKGQVKGHYFARSHEYILAYCKDKNKLPYFKYSGDDIIEAQATMPITDKNPESEFLFPAGTKFEAPDGTELSGSWGGEKVVKLIRGRMIAKDGKLMEDIVLAGGWPFKNKMKAWFSGQEAIDVKGQKIIEFYFSKSGALRYRKERGVLNPATVLRSLGSATTGTILLKRIFGEKVFGYPKPLELIKFLLSFTTNDNSIILDFFAGSGTTGQAVLELNKEDGGSRQFILVTNNEFNKKEYKDDYKASLKEREYWTGRVRELKHAISLTSDPAEREPLEANFAESRIHLKTYEDKVAELEEYGICTAVTYPRLLSVIEGFHLPDDQQGTGGNLRYYRVDYEPFADVDALEFVYRVAEKCGGLIALKERAYTPIEGLSPTAGYEVYTSSDKIVAIHTTPTNTAALREIENVLLTSDKPEKIFYTFSLATDKKFGNSEYVEWKGIKVKPFPQAILNHYRRLAEKLAK